MRPLWQENSASVPSRAVEPDERRDVVIVGAGLTGLATALMLLRDGRDVALVDQGGIAALTTGANTGKVSLLQGDRLAAIRRHHPAYLVRAYVDANRDGMRWLTEFADAAAVPYTRRTDHVYAQTSDGVDAVDAVYDAAREAGLPVRRVAPDGHAFPVASAVALDDQVAIDPVRLAVALAQSFVAEGGTLHTGTRVTGFGVLPEPHVATADGPIRADQIVLATGTPIAYRGLYFAKTRGLRSSCVSFRVPGDALDGMYISLDTPTRSLRPVSAADGPPGVADLIVGGNGHPVGRGGSERARVQDLVAWTKQHFPGAEETHRWSAQDYESHNLVPFVGVLPRSLGRVRFATGYAKWGLSNAPAAALRLAAELRGVRWRDRPRWMVAIGTRITVPADIGRGAAENAVIAAEDARGWTDAAARPVPIPRPAEGEGIVAQRGGHPVGVSTVDGVTRGVSAVCTHLGGVLRWNDAECTWDCPLHASRFTADGRRIEGPAPRNLAPVPRSPAASA